MKWAMGGYAPVTLPKPKPQPQPKENNIENI